MLISTKTIEYVFGRHLRSRSMICRDLSREDKPWSDYMFKSLLSLETQN